MTGETWTLRVSVKLLEEKSISGLESEPTFQFGTAEFKAKLSAGHLILEACYFESEAAALAYVPLLKGGLWNVAIDRRISFVPYFEQRTITRSGDPEQLGRKFSQDWGHPYTGPVHGLTEEAGVTVYRTGENIRFASMSASGYSFTRWPMVETALIEGMQLGGAFSEPTCSRLTVALDLYLAHLSEVSVRARFLTLIMVLEVLAPVTEKHPDTVSLLQGFAATVQIKLDEARDKETQDAMQALLNDFKFRKEMSIRRRVRQLILDEVPLPEPELSELSRKVVSAYDLRGSLVHTGEVKDLALSEAYFVALEATKLVLRERLRLDSQKNGRSGHVKEEG